MAATRPHKIEVYADASGQWRWRRKAGNGRIVADSGEAYVRRYQAASVAHEQFPDDTLVVEDPESEREIDDDELEERRDFRLKNAGAGVSGSE